MKEFTIHQRRLLISGYIFLSFISFLTSQTRSNPFEIKPRLKTLNITDTFTPAADINALLTDTLTNVTGKVNNKSDNDDKTAENPFEIDHVPLRKTTMSLRTENLKNQSEGTRISNGFLFWFMLLGCGILAVVLNTKSKAPGLIYSSILNENMLKLFQREENNKFSAYLFLLYVVFCINFAIFLYLVSSYFGGPRGIFIFLLMLVGSGIVYTIKHVSLNLLGEIFRVTKNTDLYSFAIMIFNLFAGMVLIPVNFFLAFGPEGLKPIILGFVFVFLAVLILLRTIRGIFIVSEHLMDRLFQIFIYLCAFEIAPVLILIKSVMNLGQ